MSRARVRIATRRSPLALWQAEHVRHRLQQQDAALEVELLPMVTQGDRLTSTTLVELGGKGLFVKELEQAMLEGRADLAVHSMKDVPAELPQGLCLAALLEGEDPRDALVARDAHTLDSLPAGSRVGTSSLRRRAQLRRLRPDLEIVEVRGNVGTRLGHVDDGRLDGVLLARAGLLRLRLEARITATLEVDRFVPAIGQGVIGIECRAGDHALLERLAGLHDEATAVRVRAERAFGARLGSSCRVPVAAHARLVQDRLHLTGVIAHPDGDPLLREADDAAPGQAQALGERLAQRLLGLGGEAILAPLRDAR